MKRLIIAVALVTVFSACNNKEKEREAVVAQQRAVQAAKDSIRLDSLNRAQAVELQAARDREIAQAAAAQQRISSSRSSGGGGTNSNYGGSVQSQEAKKKGWSESAKGATIGGLAGAVGGALIDKKKGRGAVIGGVIGAGTGYVIGRDKDVKSGRVQPKN